MVNTTVFCMFKKKKKLGRDTVHAEMIQIQFVETDIVPHEMKNLLDWISGRLDTAEKKIKGLEDITIEVIQKKVLREKRIKKTEPQ